MINALPNFAHTGARKALQEVTGAEDRTHAEQAAKQFAKDYGKK